MNPNKIWFEKDPNDLLRNVLLGNPAASEKEIFDAVSSEVVRDPGYWGSIITHWFASSYPKVAVEVIGPGSVRFQTRLFHKSPPEDRAERRAAEIEAVENIKLQITKNVLMDFVLSNGKALRSATFGDCANEGGWLLAISKRGRANEIVGKKLTEADLVNLQRRFVEGGKAA